jgi:hypothetical protein
MEAREGRKGQKEAVFAPMGVHGECLGEVCSPNPNSKVPLLAAVMIEEFLKGQQ